jgi:hypothetical protein
MEFCAPHPTVSAFSVVDVCPNHGIATISDKISLGLCEEIARPETKPFQFI